jgi:hypothetical protein
MTSFALRSLVLALVVALLLINVATPARTQTSEVSGLSYQAFQQLSRVYTSGGSAPQLVRQLNTAITIIEDARIKVIQGDTVTATRLENQARSIINTISPEITAAQQAAIRNSTSTAEFTIAEASLVVAVSTLGFLGTLLVWRWYEKEKLFEMKIIAEET